MVQKSLRAIKQCSRHQIPPCRAVRRQQELRFPGLFKLCEAILAQPLHCFQVREPTLGILCLVSSSSEIGNELAQVKHSCRPHSNLSSGLFEVGFRCAHPNNIGFVSEMHPRHRVSAHRPWVIPFRMPASMSLDDAAVAPLVRKTAAWSWRLLVIAAAAWVLFDTLTTLGVVIVPVALALMLTALLVPAVDFLDRRGAPRGGAVALVLICGLAAVGGHTRLRHHPVCRRLTPTN